MWVRLIPVLMTCSAWLAGGGAAVRAEEPPGAVPSTQPRDQTRIAGTRSLGGGSMSRAAPSRPATSERSARGNGGITPVGTAPISLAELEALALRNNPTIKAAEALVLQQQGLLRQLTRYPNPTAGWVQSTPSRRSEGATQGAFISQDVVTAGKLRVVNQAERVEIEWRCLQLKAQIGRVLNDVRVRYYEVLGAQQALAVATELERLAADDLRIIDRLLKAKQASRPDVLQAEIHLSAVRASLENVRLRHQAAWRQLANLVGVPQLPPARLPDEVETEAPPFEWDETLRRLLSESPVLRAQAAQVRQAELEVQLQKRLVVPNINVQTVIQRDYVKNFNEVSTLVSAPIPLFNRNRGAIINAEGTLRQQQQEYKRLQLALADQLATSFQQYQSARNQAEHLREILPRTRENVELTTQAFRQGQAGFDFLRVRNAEDLYHQTRSSYIDAMTTLRKVAIEIEGLELVGGLNPTEIGTALQATPGVPSGLGGVLLQFQQQQQTGVGGTLPGVLQSTVTGP